MKFQRIRDLRTYNDLTQAELARMINVSQNTYSRYETGDVSVPIEVLIDLAHIFHTSLDYLVEFKCDEVITH